MKRKTIFGLVLFGATVLGLGVFSGKAQALPEEACRVVYNQCLYSCPKSKWNPFRATCRAHCWVRYQSCASIPF